MPYIKSKERNFVLKYKELIFLVEWLRTVKVQDRKGFVAFIVNFIAKHSFTPNYFGMSTGTDAVRSAYREMLKELDEYEAEKKKVNGRV